MVIKGWMTHLNLLLFQRTEQLHQKDIFLMDFKIRNLLYKLELNEDFPLIHTR